MKMTSLLILGLFTILFCGPSVDAQDRRGGYGRDRGGDDGGSRWGGGRGGDRGSFRGRGGFGGGPPRGGPPGGGRMTMDRNGDGRLDQSEIDAIHPRFREMLESRGAELQPGMSVDDMRNSMRSAFSRGRDDDDDDDDRDRGRRGGRDDDDDRSAGNRSDYRRSDPFRPRTKDRVTVDLPPKYSDLDSDYDGQVGYYEWMVERREDLDLFHQVDRNGDGLLTPRELEIFEESSEPNSSEAITTSLKRERLLIVDGSGSSRSGGRSEGSGGNSRGDSRGGEDRDENEERAERFFGFMDRDRDGRLSEEELSRSRYLRPMFERADIRLTSMSKEEFIRNYARAAEQSR